MMKTFALIALAPLVLAACTQEDPSKRPAVAPAAKIVGASNDMKSAPIAIGLAIINAPLTSEVITHQKIETW